jgi:secreted PhoX family phosphatase
MWYQSLGDDYGLLVINHEYGDNSVVLGKSLPDNLDDVRTSQYNHGVSVIELARTNGHWQTVNTGGSASFFCPAQA